MSSSGSYPSTSKNKSSTSFGVLWIPTRKHNRQKKDQYYESYKDDYKIKKHPHNYFMKEDQAEGSDNAKPSSALVGSTATGGGAVFANNDDDNEDTTNLVSRSRHNSGSDDNKQGAGDTKDTADYLEDHDPDFRKKAKPGQHDKMDGVYVKPPSNKRRGERSDNSTEPTDKCDQCIVDCLYYSIQCCHCTIM